MHGLHLFQLTPLYAWFALVPTNSTACMVCTCSNYLHCMHGLHLFQLSPLHAWSALVPTISTACMVCTCSNYLHSIYICMHGLFNLHGICLCAGRVLNRFSKDVGFLDDLLPYIYTEFVLVCAQLAGKWDRS